MKKQTSSRQTRQDGTDTCTQNQTPQLTVTFSRANKSRGVFAPISVQHCQLLGNKYPFSLLLLLLLLLCKNKQSPVGWFDRQTVWICRSTTFGFVVDWGCHDWVSFSKICLHMDQPCCYLQIHRSKLWWKKNEIRKVKKILWNVNEVILAWILGGEEGCFLYWIIGK